MLSKINNVLSFFFDINIVYFINWILVKLIFAMSNWFIWIKTLFCLLVKRVNVCIDSKHVKISNFLNFISWKPLADDMRRPLDKANKMSLVLKDINDLALISRSITFTILSSSSPLKFFDWLPEGIWNLKPTQHKIYIRHSNPDRANLAWRLCHRLTSELSRLDFFTKSAKSVANVIIFSSMITA